MSDISNTIDEKTKEFEASSESRDGFLIMRKRADHVEIEQGGKTLSKIHGDITEQIIDQQISRIKEKQRKA